MSEVDSVVGRRSAAMWNYTAAISCVVSLTGPLLAADDYSALGTEIVEIVSEDFLDAERAAEWASLHTGYAEDVGSREVFVSRTNEALSRLDTSHTRYYPRGSAGYWGLLAIFGDSLGVGRVEYEGIGADIDDRGFARRVLAGGPAERSGLLRGDRILRVDDEPFTPIGTFQGKADSTVLLAVRRHAEEAPLEFTATVRRIHPLDEWKEAQKDGARVIPHKGLQIAYAPVLWCVGEDVEAWLREQFAVGFRDADAVVLDFRDGWGGCNPDFLDFFNSSSPVLSLIDRAGQVRTFDPHWRKPLVILINGRTRSGKEVVAYGVRRGQLGTLVGQKTAGFVVGGRPYLLSDGSVLYLAVMDARVDGERLEGVGVLAGAHRGAARGAAGVHHHRGPLGTHLGHRRVSPGQTAQPGRRHQPPPKCRSLLGRRCPRRDRRRH